MELQLILKIYLCAFLPLVMLTAFVWPIWRNYHRTGVNPLVLRRSDDSAYGFVGQVFKYLTISVFVVATLYVAAPSLYVHLTVIPYLDALAPLKWVGMGLGAMSLALTVVAQTQMGASWRIGIDHERRTELVARGVFRYSRNPIYLAMIGLTPTAEALRLRLLPRNPIYLAMIGLTGGLLLMLPTAATAAIWLCTFMILHVQVRLEEEHMRKLHPQAYADYCRRVRRWL